MFYLFYFFYEQNNVTIQLALENKQKQNKKIWNEVVDFC